MDLRLRQICLLADELEPVIEGEASGLLIGLQIKSGDSYATLNDGQSVEFEVGQGQKGPCANNVVPV